MPLSDREFRTVEPLRSQGPSLEDLLRKLTDLSSWSHDRDGVNRVGEVMAGRLEALGFRIAELVSGKGGRTLVARRTGDSSHRLLLLGHLDTVHPPESTFRSFVAGAAGSDLATGPGVADMKGGLVVLVSALEALHATGNLDGRHVTVVLSADEEIGSANSADLVRAEASESELCLGFEPGRLLDDGSSTFVTARRGYGRVNLRVRGRAAHAGVDPERGTNALLELAHKIIALQALNDPAAGVSVNVGTVHGGTAANVVPEEAVAEVDFRFPDEDAQADLEESIARIAGATLAPGLSAGSIVTRVSDPVKRPSMPRTEAAARMAARLVAAGADLGFRLTEEARGGSSDAAFAAEVGCPAVCGLGAVGGAYHTEEEWVRLSSLVDRSRLAALSALRFFDLRAGAGS